MELSEFNKELRKRFDARVNFYLGQITTDENQTSLRRQNAHELMRQIHEDEAPIIEVIEEIIRDAAIKAIDNGLDEMEAPLHVRSFNHD